MKTIGFLKKIIVFMQKRCTVPNKPMFSTKFIERVPKKPIKPMFWQLWEDRAGGGWPLDRAIVAKTLVLLVFLVPFQ